MKPVKRPTRRVAFRAGIAAFAAMMVLALSSYLPDDLPWWWADASDINTIDLAGMPSGPHEIRIELVNANHEVFPRQPKTVAFTIPQRASLSHGHSHPQ